MTLRTGILAGILLLAGAAGAAAEPGATEATGAPTQIGTAASYVSTRVQNTGAEAANPLRHRRHRQIIAATAPSNDTSAGRVSQNGTAARP